MRSWFALAAVMLVPLAALAGPQDPWTVDPEASAITFSVAQMGSIVSGRFPTWTGEIVLDPAALATARIDIRIDTRAVSANNRDIDSLMKSANFFDVSKFAEARFVSASISGGGERFEARGKLTLRDVTRDVVLPFTLAIVDDPSQPGRVRAMARGRITLKRLDYGVGQNEWAATGQVANDVTVDLKVVAGRTK